jgi:glycogen debranching enzyme
MDSVVEGVQVTPRSGYIVEVNALWYNALRFSLKLAGEGGDNSFIKKWNGMPERTSESFVRLFWDPERGYLADYVRDDFQTGQSGRTRFWQPQCPTVPLIMK